MSKSRSSTNTTSENPKITLAQRRVKHLAQCIEKHGKETDQPQILEKLIKDLEALRKKHKVKTWKVFGLVDEYIQGLRDQGQLEFKWPELKMWIMKETNNKRRYTDPAEDKTLRGTVPKMLKELVKKEILKEIISKDCEKPKKDQEDKKYRILPL